MKTIDFSYFIERYLAGEMTESEKKWFKKELDGNEKLRQEVALRKHTDKVLNDQDVIQLRHKLFEIERQRATKSRVNNPGKNSAFKYAAVIAGFILIGSLALLNTRNVSNDEIFNKYYKSYESVSTSRSQQAVTNTDYSTALDYYNIHDYKNAARFFAKVLNDDPGNMESTMLYGSSNFEDKNYPVAEQSFKTVITNNDNLYIEEAQWFLALCYLQTDEQSKAIKQLTLIKDSESIYRKDARKILKRIQ
jgi:tetratricopeptide (TPR) repeat protein